ncbi:hypothetical protein [Muriicola sp. Z0-33]|uniref:hypothetical protein n=1 Tax=Muriicola sp. Z0-33 TaxID=2816957 RepID=UPI002237F1F7|nr:hypothetical protein [Muriicola sp. Z0-33]MCW5518152.1 hypothetical protein [Muriicola sp. Z0-33]
MNTEKIIEIFKSEFEFIENKFIIIEEKINKLNDSQKEFIYNPGVYILIDNNLVIKVGRHFTNSRKRALEHIKANTKNELFEMKNLIHSNNSKAILINLKDKNEFHWIASVEIYLEQKLSPLIKTKRL